MTPKEKAQELVLKYASTTVTTYGCGAATGNACIITNVMLSNSCKKCALIAVDEIIRIEKHHMHNLWVDYWQEVKQEIEKL